MFEYTYFGVSTELASNKVKHVLGVESISTSIFNDGIIVLEIEYYFCGWIILFGFRNNT